MQSIGLQHKCFETWEPAAEELRLTPIDIRHNLVRLIIYQTGYLAGIAVASGLIVILRNTRRSNQ
jgi:hypothetical protein